MTDVLGGCVGADTRGWLVDWWGVGEGWVERWGLTENDGGTLNSNRLLAAICLG